MVLFMDRSIDYFPVFAHGTSYASMLETICKIDSSGSRILTGK